MRTGAPIRLALKDAAAVRRSFARILRAFYVGEIEEARFAALDRGFATLARLFEVESTIPSALPVQSSPDFRVSGAEGQAGRLSFQNAEKAPRTRPSSGADDLTASAPSTQRRASAVRMQENERPSPVTRRLHV